MAVSVAGPGLDCPDAGRSDDWVRCTAISCGQLLALPLAGGVAFVRTNNFHYLAARARVSKKFGDLDVWGFVFNSNATEWVVVRDIKYDLMYQGWVHAFSDTADDNELLLRRHRTETRPQLSYTIEALYLPARAGI
jgi:hypothetical protein